MHRAIVSVFAVAFSVSAAGAQQFMKPIPETNDFEPEILNGKPAVASEWRATLQFESSGGFCTSTIIGEKVILTAGHCVANNAKALVVFNNKKLTVTCTHHTQYKGASCLTAVTVAQIA